MSDLGGSTHSVVDGLGVVRPVAGAGRSRVGGYTLTLIVALAQHWTPDVPPFAGAGGLAVATGTAPLTTYQALTAIRWRISGQRARRHRRLSPPAVRRSSRLAERCVSRGALPYLWSAASLEIPSSVRTVAPAVRPVTAPWSAVAASASANVAPTWSDRSPSASAATRAASRVPSART
jgi:hypothetical protein